MLRKKTGSIRPKKNKIAIKNAKFSYFVTKTISVKKTQFEAIFFGQNEAFFGHIFGQKQSFLQAFCKAKMGERGRGFLHFLIFKKNIFYLFLDKKKSKNVFFSLKIVNFHGIIGGREGLYIEALGPKKDQNKQNFDILFT